MSMKRSKSIDLTSGPILKTLAELALPIMASSFLGTAYNITDMAWIGLLGSKAVAGVGVGGMYVWLSQGLVALPRMGGQVNTAQACGRKDYKEAGFYAASALQMTILFGLLFAVASIVFLFVSNSFPSTNLIIPFLVVNKSFLSFIISKLTSVTMLSPWLL